jgi:hypothetical protein
MLHVDHVRKDGNVLELTAFADEQEIFSDCVDVTNSSWLEEFIQAIIDKRPDVRRQDIEAELERILDIVHAEGERAKTDSQSSPTDPDHPYTVDGGRICRKVETSYGGRYRREDETSSVTKLIPLTNFDARIVSEVVLDDGLEIVRKFKISGKLASGKDLPEIVVPIEEFRGGDWPLTRWGKDAVVYAGTTKEHLRAAVQLLSSGEATTQYVFTHTGWRRLRWTPFSGPLGMLN